MQTEVADRFILLIITRSQSVTSTMRAADLIRKIKIWLHEYCEDNCISPATNFTGFPIGSAPYDVYLIRFAQGSISDLWEYLTTLDWYVFGVTLIYQERATTATKSLTLGHRWEDVCRMERIVRVG
ncbi:MAG TPA: hypothetical protein VFC63_29305 [Blastocatellia bacterium]|nr:hypothetical protein [Blastocatellia bacterium]